MSKIEINTLWKISFKKFPNTEINLTLTNE